jgi:hypothetical protein
MDDGSELEMKTYLAFMFALFLVPSVLKAECVVELRGVPNGALSEQLIRRIQEKSAVGRGKVVWKDKRAWSGKASRHLVVLFSAVDRGQDHGRPGFAYMVIWLLSENGQEQFTNFIFGYRDESFIDTIAQSAVDPTILMCTDLQRYFGRRTQPH